MDYLRSIVFIVLLGCVLGDDALLDPCGHRDSDCIGKNTEKFLDKTSAGIPQYNIKPIDPLEIKHVEYAYPGSGVVMHYKNIKITGLKKLRISNFTMNIESKSVILQAKLDVNVDSDLTVELRPPRKELLFSGPYNANASNVYVTAYYNYDLVPNDKGLVFYEVGPETITCESADVPKISLGSQLAESIYSTDEDATARRAHYEKREEIRKNAICAILSNAYATAIHNIRATAKVLPKTAFFTDV